MNWTAIVDKVVDADTLDVNVDVGFHTTVNARLRIADVDAYERGTPQGDAATTDLTAQLAGRTISLITYRDRDKYGRHLATVRMPSGNDLAAYIKEHNWAKTP
jgi:endonuclease YncB( thermonuclease family)